MENEQTKVYKNWWRGYKEDDAKFFTDANEKIKKIEEKLNAFKETSSIEGKSTSSLNDKKSKLLETLIKHYLDLTKALDVRRAEYFKAGLQMFAISLAAIGVLIKYADLSRLTFVSLITLAFIIGLISLIYTAFSIVTTYYWQTKSDRYHFLNINPSEHPYLGNSWLWFYHGVPGVGNIPFIKKSSSISAENDNRTGSLAYIEGAEFYFTSFIDATENDLIIQHLKHTYLLLVHNAYKNKFDRQLTDLVSKGTRRTGIITLVCVVLAVLLALIMQVPYSKVGNSNLTEVDSVSILKPNNTNLIIVDSIGKQVSVNENIDTSIKFVDSTNNNRAIKDSSIVGN